jgi:hypothetical protein
MVEALVIGLIGFCIGTGLTLGFVLLIMIYNNTKDASEKKKDDAGDEDKDEDGSFIIPLGPGMGGAGGRGLTYADIQAYVARQAAAGAAPPTTDTTKAAGGNYI